MLSICKLLAIGMARPSNAKINRSVLGDTNNHDSSLSIGLGKNDPQSNLGVEKVEKPHISRTEAFDKANEGNFFKQYYSPEMKEKLAIYNETFPIPDGLNPSSTHDHPKMEPGEDPSYYFDLDHEPKVEEPGKYDHLILKPKEEEPGKYDHLKLKPKEEGSEDDWLSRFNLKLESKEEEPEVGSDGEWVYYDDLLYFIPRKNNSSSVSQDPTSTTTNPTTMNNLNTSTTTTNPTTTVTNPTTNDSDSGISQKISELCLYLREHNSLGLFWGLVFIIVVALIFIVIVYYMSRKKKYRSLIDRSIMLKDDEHDSSIAITMNNH